MVVAHTYGRLKGRWRCLLKRLDVDVGDTPKLVATCVLHNLCEDSLDDEWLEGVEHENLGTSTSSILTDNATDIRNAFSTVKVHVYTNTVIFNLYSADVE